MYGTENGYPVSHWQIIHTLVSV